MNINTARLAELAASNWSLVIFTPYSRPAQSFFGSEEDMMRLCNCGDGTELEHVTEDEYNKRFAADEWSGEWEGEGFYGRYNEAGDYQHIDDTAEEAVYRILSHDSSNNFSWRGNVEEAVADVSRHRLIREALEKEGVIEPEPTEEEDA